MRNFIDIVESTKPDKKTNRSAFVYLPPKGKKEQFAQCETCEKFIKDKNQCALFTTKDKVKPEDSCGLYIHGKPDNNQKPMNIVTPEQAGYVHGPVRCQNCSWSDGEGHCDLYKLLNKKLSNVFDLDENIEANACCNAFSAS